MKDETERQNDNPAGASGNAIPLKWFILKRVDAMLRKNEIRTAFELLHALDPLPCPFNTVLEKINEEKFNTHRHPYRERLKDSIRVCLLTIKRGRFSTY